jgi:hypothetical protein
MMDIFLEIKKVSVLQHLYKNTNPPLITLKNSH